MRQKIVYIIPGYKHKPTNKAYKEIAKMLKSEGYKPVLVKIPWKESTISQNTEYFLKKFHKINSKEKYILGFSFGAMIAFIASTKVRVSGLILCSLSPFFKEDLKRKENKWTSPLMRQRYQDFSGLSCFKLAKKIRAKQILMLYGAKEERSLKKRVNEAFYEINISYKYLFSVKKAEHNIGDRRYLYTIRQLASEFLT